MIDFSTITPEQVLTELGHIVAEKGADYVYVNPQGVEAGTRRADGSSALCVNFAPDGAPSCGVGHWLALHGVSKSYRNRPEHGEAAASTGVYSVLKDTDVPRKVIDILEAFQGRQDGGKTWGQALEAAYAVGF